MEDCLYDVMKFVEFICQKAPLVLPIISEAFCMRFYLPKDDVKEFNVES